MKRIPCSEIENPEIMGYRTHEFFAARSPYLSTSCMRV
jgi:hypothetical protein